MLRTLLPLLVWLVTSAASFAALAGAYDEILVAARDNRAEVVMDLVQRGMDANTSDRSGTTLLMFAARSGNEQLIEFLLEKRANVLKQNKFGDNAVGLAALNGSLPVVRRLVAGGADIAARGWNALHYAAYNGHVDIVRFLVAKGAALDARAPNQQTALMLAARNGHQEVVKLLIDADADMDLEDAQGNTALGLALKAGNSAIAAYLRGEGAVEQPASR
jgi:ankyrin repeat protein